MRKRPDDPVRGTRDTQYPVTVLCPRTTLIAGTMIATMPSATHGPGAARTVVRRIGRSGYLRTLAKFPDTAGAAARGSFDWAPYRMAVGFGNLIGDGPGFPEPWGWAPYHYGRWFIYDNSWVWWPSQSYAYVNYRPIWAPAMFRSSGSAAALGLDSVAASVRWAGFRSGPVTGSIRGGVDTGRTSAS